MKVLIISVKNCEDAAYVGPTDESIEQHLFDFVKDNWKTVFDNEEIEPQPEEVTWEDVYHYFEYSMDDSYTLVDADTPPLYLSFSGGRRRVNWENEKIDGPCFLISKYHSVYDGLLNAVPYGDTEVVWFTVSNGLLMWEGIWYSDWSVSLEPPTGAEIIDLTKVKY